jgi:hypothetical protein
VAAHGDDDELPEPDPTSIDFYMRGLEEAPAPFLPIVPTVEELGALYRNVLEAYGWTCALTHTAFAPAEGLHPQLQVVAIRPIRDGGVMDERNFMALTLEASRAFERGDLSIGPDHAIIVDRLGIDRELARKLGAVLLLPSRNLPDPEALRWHREVVFASIPPDR